MKFDIWNWNTHLEINIFISSDFWYWCDHINSITGTEDNEKYW